MNFVEVKDGVYVSPSIKVVENAFDKCKELISICESINDWHSLSEGPGGGLIKYMDLEVGFNHHPIFFEVAQILYLHGKKFAEESSTSFGTMEKIRVFKFKPNGSTEIGYESTLQNPREFCSVLNLNSVAGGEILFPEFDIGFIPIEGNMIIFPANFAYKHKENAPETENKYSLVAWFTQP